MFLKVSRNSQENTCASISFLIRPATLFKKRLRHRCFPVNFAKFLATPFFIEHLRATASVIHFRAFFYFYVYIGIIYVLLNQPLHLEVYQVYRGLPRKLLRELWETMAILSKRTFWMSLEDLYFVKKVWGFYWENRG